MSQLSCAQEVRIDDETDDMAECLRNVKGYIKAKIEEIKGRVSSGSRSILDFVDIAVVVGALANITDTDQKCDTQQYIDFVETELVPMSANNKDVIATAFYCLMRCGLVHQMSLGGHNIRPVRQQVINGWSICITHDKSKDGKWYSIDALGKELVFYASELLSSVESCIDRCFDGVSNLSIAIERNIQSSEGIKIIGIKK